MNESIQIIWANSYKILGFLGLMVVMVGLVCMVVAAMAFPSHDDDKNNF